VSTRFATPSGAVRSRPRIAVPTSGRWPSSPWESHGTTFITPTRRLPVTAFVATNSTRRPSSSSCSNWRDGRAKYVGPRGRGSLPAQNPEPLDGIAHHVGAIPRAHRDVGVGPLSVGQRDVDVLLEGAFAHDHGVADAAAGVSAFCRHYGG